MIVEISSVFSGQSRNVLPAFLRGSFVTSVSSFFKGSFIVNVYVVNKKALSSENANLS